MTVGTFAFIWIISCFFSSWFLLPLLEKIDLVDDAAQAGIIVLFSCITVPLTLLGVVCWGIHSLGCWVFES